MTPARRSRTLGRSLRRAQAVTSPWPAIMICALLASCEQAPRDALGTLERDRITLPAPVSERIASIAVREGDVLAAGDTVLMLESERSQARLQSAQAEVARLEYVLALARNGPRRDQIDELRARAARAEALAAQARQERVRIETLVKRGLLPVAERDRASAANLAADADVRAARAALAELQRGTREETIAQAEAALRTAQANARAVAVDADRVRVAAPRAGIVDSLPYRVGDQPPVGTTLAVLLVGEVPYARVYVPQPLRTGVVVGTAAKVFVQGSDAPHAGRVRSVRNEPSFTPYYALSGEDAARLSYLAEIELGSDAAALPAGVPVRAEFEITK